MRFAYWLEQENYPFNPVLLASKLAVERPNEWRKLTQHLQGDIIAAIKKAITIDGHSPEDVFVHLLELSKRLPDVPDVPVMPPEPTGGYYDTSPKGKEEDRSMLNTTIHAGSSGAYRLIGQGGRKWVNHNKEDEDW